MKKGFAEVAGSASIHDYRSDIRKGGGSSPAGSSSSKAGDKGGVDRQKGGKQLMKSGKAGNKSKEPTFAPPFEFPVPMRVVFNDDDYTPSGGLYHNKAYENGL